MYLETYRAEPGFPTHPELDTLGLNGMGAASDGATGVAPPVPALTGDRASAAVSSTAAANTLESASTYVDARPLLASGVPFKSTGRFAHFDISREPGALGLVAMLLYSSTTRSVVSASLYVYSDGTTLFPSLNIAELAPDAAPKITTQFLPGIRVTSEPFDLTLVVDPATGTANTRLEVGGVTYELTPLALNPAASDIYQPDTLTQTLGMDNRSGPGHSASVDFIGFRVTTPLVRALIDVKPGDPRNVINLLGRDPTPVAIFSTRDFDAMTITPNTLTLGGAPVARSRRGDFLCVAARLNRDNRPDLLCQIVTSQIDAPIGESVVTLHAFTAEGAPVVGEDRLRRVR